MTTFPLARLIDAFQKLPGVGPKSAQRLAFHVIQQSESFVCEFTDAMIQAKQTIHPCPICYHLSGQSPCEICTQANRDRRLLCVVADARDVLALERTQGFKGLYHVLGGLISPLDGIGPDKLNIAALLKRLQQEEPTSEITLEDTTEAAPPPVMIQELILALPPSTEGDTTSLYIQHLLNEVPLTLSRIAFGLPVGGDLDYADSLTINRALQGRQVMI
jgi:recombination protein RecR